MFIQFVFLLLVFNSVFLDARKIQNTLKEVGKRYFDNEFNQWPSFAKSMIEDERFSDWETLSEEKVEKKKLRTAHAVVNTLVEVSSSYNWMFNQSLVMLETILDPEMTAEICGDGKILNSYQYMKHMKTASTQNLGRFPKSEYFDILKTDRNVLHIVMNFTQVDRTGLKVIIENEIKMKLTFSTEWHYSIEKVIEGGSCANTGLASFSSTELEGIDWLIDDLEGLKTNPTTKLFLKLFTPAVYQYVEENPNKLPRYWLSGLNASLTIINVCHEEVTNSVEYTEEKFRSWYRHFGLMWHPKEGADDADTYKIQILDSTNDSIIARITMKLQMGRKGDAAVHDWNFKFSGKKNDASWYIERLEVICDPTVNYKDQSLTEIRNVVAGKFVDELKYQNNTQWYSTVDFIREFSKHGHVELTDCVKDTIEKITRIDLFTKDQNEVHGIRFTKYQIEEGEISLPAADFNKFRFTTVSEATDDNSDQKIENEHEWTFDIKWDQMDQFYYIEKMGIGCKKPFTLGGMFSSMFDKFGR